MGYTHYWYRPSIISGEVFKAIRADFERLILPLADSGVQLADGLGDGVPVITDDDIRFNGVRQCGHPKNDAIAIPYPSEGASGVGPSYDAIEDSDEELITRIRHRCCDGSCSYETFGLPRCLQHDDAGQLNTGGLCIEFTKTGFRPYDIAVTAALLGAKRALKNQLVVHTDGTDCQWSDAKRICQSVLGYGDWFGIVEEQVEEELPGSSDMRTAMVRTLVEMHPPALGS